MVTCCSNQTFFANVWVGLKCGWGSANPNPSRNPNPNTFYKALKSIHSPAPHFKLTQCLKMDNVYVV